MTFDAREEGIVTGSGVGVFLNPGSGPVDGTSEEHALTNLVQLARDLRERGLRVGEPTRLPERDEGGRYGFRLPVEDREHVIDMPGLPVEEVRYLGQESGNIWHFPRLYVDESSWVWKYALNIIIDHDEDDD